MSKLCNFQLVSGLFSYPKTPSNSQVLTETKKDYKSSKENYTINVN